MFLESELHDLQAQIGIIKSMNSVQRDQINILYERTDRLLNLLNETSAIVTIIAERLVVLENKDVA